eukprot:1156911-Pelagomonas_calceolata.AAC.1
MGSPGHIARTGGGAPPLTPRSSVPAPGCAAVCEWANASMKCSMYSAALLRLAQLATRSITVHMQHCMEFMGGMIGDDGGLVCIGWEVILLDHEVFKNRRPFKNPVSYVVKLNFGLESQVGTWAAR